MINAFVLTVCLIIVFNSVEVEVNTIDYETFKEIENDIVSDSQYNFQVMRDIFTPMYNDSVTVENAGYDKGWMFWVNHSKVLNSYYFEDMNNYLMRFNSSSNRVELVVALKIIEI